jgi:Domain of unknown function (DUF4386)
MLGINTLMYSAVFYGSGLVPRPLAVMGLTGATLVFICALLVLFGVIAQISVWGALLSVPVALSERTLAVWLIAKRFNSSAIAFEHAKPVTNELLSGE